MQVGGLVTKTTGAILFQEQTIKKWVVIFSENTLHQICLYHIDKSHNHFYLLFTEGTKNCPVPSACFRNDIYLANSILYTRISNNNKFLKVAN